MAFTWTRFSSLFSLLAYVDDNYRDDRFCPVETARGFLPRSFEHLCQDANRCSLPITSRCKREENFPTEHANFEQKFSSTRSRSVIRGNVLNNLITEKFCYNCFFVKNNFFFFHRKRRIFIQSFTDFAFAKLIDRTLTLFSH